MVELQRLSIMLVVELFHCSNPDENNEIFPLAMENKDGYPIEVFLLPKSSFQLISSFTMCRQVIESLFHNCGHIERTEVQSINPECTAEIIDVLYHEEKFCQLCIWGRFEPECRYTTSLSLRCGARQERVKQPFSKISIIGIPWARMIFGSGETNLWNDLMCGRKGC